MKNLLLANEILVEDFLYLIENGPVELDKNDKDIIEKI